MQLKVAKSGHGHRKLCWTFCWNETFSSPINWDMHLTVLSGNFWLAPTQFILKKILTGTLGLFSWYLPLSMNSLQVVLRLEEGKGLCPSALRHTLALGPPFPTWPQVEAGLSMFPGWPVICLAGLSKLLCLLSPASVEADFPSPLHLPFSGDREGGRGLTFKSWWLFSSFFTIYPKASRACNTPSDPSETLEVDQPFNSSYPTKMVVILQLPTNSNHLSSLNELILTQRAHNGACIWWLLYFSYYYVIILYNHYFSLFNSLWNYSDFQ